MKIFTFIFATLTSISAIADVGTISCTNISKNVRKAPLQAVASGTIESTTDATTGEITFKTHLSSIHLFSFRGAISGSVINDISVSTVGEYTGDYLDLDYTIIEPANLLKSIHLDLSSANRSPSLFNTKRGNTYRSDCSVQWPEN